MRNEKDESKELAVESQHSIPVCEKIAEESSREDETDYHNDTEDFDSDESYSRFDLLWYILGRVAVIVIILTGVFFAGSMIKERISLKNQIAEMQIVIDEQTELLSKDYKIVDFDSIEAEDSDETMKLLIGELKTSQVYIENQIYSLTVQQVSEENMVKFYQKELEKVENPDIKYLFQDLLENHVAMNEELLSKLEEMKSIKEEFNKVLEIIESGETIPQEDLERIFEGEEELGIL